MYFYYVMSLTVIEIKDQEKKDIFLSENGNYNCFYRCIVFAYHWFFTLQLALKIHFRKRLETFQINNTTLSFPNMSTKIIFNQCIVTIKFLFAG